MSRYLVFETDPATFPGAVWVVAEAVSQDEARQYGTGLVATLEDALHDPSLAVAARAWCAGDDSTWHAYMELIDEALSREETRINAKLVLVRNVPELR